MIEENSGRDDLVSRVADFAREIKQAI